MKYPTNISKFFDSKLEKIYNKRNGERNYRSGHSFEGKQKRYILKGMDKENNNNGQGIHKMDQNLALVGYLN